MIKQIPKTGCKQHKSEIEYDPLCPLVVENEVCSDVEKTVRFHQNVLYFLEIDTGKVTRLNTNQSYHTWNGNLP